VYVVTAADEVWPAGSAQIMRAGVHVAADPVVVEHTEAFGRTIERNETVRPPEPSFGENFAKPV